MGDVASASIQMHRRSARLGMPLVTRAAHAALAARRGSGARYLARGRPLTMHCRCDDANTDVFTAMTQSG